MPLKIGPYVTGLLQGLNKVMHSKGNIQLDAIQVLVINAEQQPF